MNKQQSSNIVNLLSSMESRYFSTTGNVENTDSSSFFERMDRSCSCRGTNAIA